MTRRLILFAVTALALSAGTANAQPPSRRAATIDAIRTYPGFFNAQAVSIVGRVTLVGRDLMLTTDTATLRLVGQEQPAEGPAEVHGVVYDVGRMNRDDPRLTTLNLGDSLELRYGERWPRPGEELVLLVRSAGPPPAAAGSGALPIRQIAMDPTRYEGTTVAIIGEFRGRNLYADLPDAATSEREDFVLRSADGAVWVTGVKARGDDFAFDNMRRVDTGRWVRVSGTVRQGRGLVWIEGKSIELAEAPAEEFVISVPPPPPPPLDVVFTTPTEGEIDVAGATPIRVQFSRDVDPATLDGHIRISYVPEESAEPAAEPSAPVAFTTHWTPANRALEIRPSAPLEPFRHVRVELLDGIRGPDGAVLKPFTLTFSTGGVSQGTSWKP